MKFLVALAGIVAGAFPPALAGPLNNQVENASISVRVLDDRGRPVRGLSKSDFILLVDGYERDIVECLELGPGARQNKDPQDGLRIVVYVDSGLDFRQRFRARRAALALIDAIDPERDSVAVMSETALSGFTADPRRIRRLLLFFGDLGDRYGFGFPYPSPARWKRRWPASLERSRAAAALPREFANEVDKLFRNGAAGDPTSTLTRFKGLPDRKVLFFFGGDVPYRDDRLERHDPSFAARVLSDAGFTIVAFNPTGATDRGTARLQAWAGGTGGFAESHSGDLRQPALRALDLLRHGYRLTYQRPVERNCRFREALAAAVCGQCRTFYPSGDFATLNAPLSWADRTLLTAALHEADLQDFPIELSASLENPGIDGDGVDRPPRVKVSVAFHFAAAGDEGAMVRMANSGRFRQRVLFLMGVYDQTDRLLGDFQGTAYFDMEPQQAKDALTQKARLTESIELSFKGTPATARAIVVTGQNQRISTAVVRLSNRR